MQRLLPLWDNKEDTDAWLTKTRLQFEKKYPFPQYRNAWFDHDSSGKTDTAFRINDFCAVQRTHADNDCNIWPDQDLSKVRTRHAISKT